MTYLVDTDWIIDHFNHIQKTSQKLKELQPAGIAMSVISLAELYEGVHYSKNPSKSQQVIEAFLQEIPVLGIDDQICKIFGQERGRLRKQGKIISDFDLMIASTCLSYNLTLLSNNRKHYERIEGLTMYTPA
jgi:tRNA(fMet)-specific endonuclease VapC